MNITLDNMPCYLKANQDQLEKYARLKKHIYFIDQIENEGIRGEIYRFITERCERLSLLTVAKDISRFEWMTAFINEQCRDYNC